MLNIFQHLAPILDEVSQSTDLDLTSLASVAHRQASSSSGPPVHPSLSQAMQSFLDRIREGQLLQNGANSRRTSGQGLDHVANPEETL